MRVDLISRNAQGIQTVAEEGLVIQALHRLSGRPYSLSEAGTEEVVSHAPIGRREERERVHQRAAAWNTGVARGNGESLVEHPADIAGHDDRSGPGGRPHGEAVSQPRIEH